MTTTIRSERDASLIHEFVASGILEGIVALSSECLSLMMRESRIAIGYQCEDEWVIGQVRHRWRYFVTNCAAAGSAPSVDASWRAYVKNFHSVRDSWKCSYAGSTDYAWGEP